MSNSSNDNIYQRAAEAMDNNPGTVADMIEALLEANDLEELSAVLADLDSNEAWSELGDSLTPERADVLYAELKQNPSDDATVLSDIRSEVEHV